MTVGTQSKDTTRISTAGAPDLDWSQVTETVRMLNLSVAQIAMAMHEGEDSVGSLTSSFTGMVERLHLIGQQADSLEDANPAKQEILNECQQVEGGIQQTIIAFQFYDRLTQRLDHVKQALEQLSGLVSDQSRLYNPAEWGSLQANIRKRYTMQEEQDMFELLAAGASIEDALEAVRQRLNEGDIDDIELF